MFTRTIKAITVFAMLAVVGCASAPRVVVDSRPGADFSGYKTYSFVEQPGTDRAGYSTIITSHFKAAVQQEMAARGLVFDANASDLQINFFSNVENRTQTTSTPRMSVGYFHYRGGISIGFPVSSQDVETRNYKVGTVNIDVVDAKRKELVWEGVLEGTLTNKSMQNPAGAIQSAVSQIFNRFPIAKTAAPLQ